MGGDMDIDVDIDVNLSIIDVDGCLYFYAQHVCIAFMTWIAIGTCHSRFI